MNTRLRKKSPQRRHIEAIIAIADHGSVHRAAAAMGMPQPALSRILAEAEDLLGARIFDRSAHGSAPTSRGWAVISQARFVLRGMERLDSVMTVSGSTIKLGCIPRAMHTLMPHLLNRVHPHLEADQGPNPHSAFQMSVIEDSSTRLLEALSSEKLDFAVMRHVAGAAGIGADFVTEHLYDERPLIVCSAKNQVFSNRTMTLAQLTGQEWVLPSVETTSRAVLDRFWHEQRLPPIKSVIETRTFESNLALVANTPFISIVPESIAHHHANLGLIRILHVRPALPTSAVMLVYRHAMENDAVAAAFLQMVRAATLDAKNDFRKQRNRPHQLR